jgi:hypothetical protein
MTLASRATPARPDSAAGPPHDGRLNGQALGPQPRACRGVHSGVHPTATLEHLVCGVQHA